MQAGIDGALYSGSNEMRFVLALLSLWVCDAWRGFAPVLCTGLKLDAAKTTKTFSREHFDFLLNGPALNRMRLQT